MYAIELGFGVGSDRRYDAVLDLRFARSRQGHLRSFEAVNKRSTCRRRIVADGGAHLNFPEAWGANDCIQARSTMHVKPF